MSRRKETITQINERSLSGKLNVKKFGAFFWFGGIRLETTSLSCRHFEYVCHNLPVNLNGESNLARIIHLEIKFVCLWQQRNREIRLHCCQRGVVREVHRHSAVLYARFHFCFQSARIVQSPQTSRNPMQA